MVGAIADWFAVTALFKHPLGLPIPHTALIPKRKDELGRGLRGVRRRELPPGGDHPRPGAAPRRSPSGSATWLSRARATPAGWSTRSPTSPRIGLGKVQDEHIVELVETVLVPRFREEPIAPIARQPARTRWSRDDLHHGRRRPRPRGAAPLAAARNQDTFADVLSERAPWWAPDAAQRGGHHRLHTEAIRWLADIRDDPHHHARAALDSMLAQLGRGPAARRGHPGPGGGASRCGCSTTRSSRRPASRCGTRCATRCSTALRGPATAPLAERARARAGRRSPSGCTTDAALRERLDGLRRRRRGLRASTRYGAELTAVITHTIERWDGKEAARKIELHVGRDLQFIRINGTIVGGLVGVLIHTVAVLHLIQRESRTVTRLQPVESRSACE